MHPLLTLGVVGQVMLDQDENDAKLRDARAQERLSLLSKLQILDTPAEPAFDIIVESAQRQLRCKIAVVCLIDDRRQWFKARRGIDVDYLPHEEGMCIHAVEANATLVVPDARSDRRFAGHPAVAGPNGVRLYAGVPIRIQVSAADERRVPIGTLCVVDDRSRFLSDAEVRLLGDLAQLVEKLLEARMTAIEAAAVAEDRRLALENLERTHRQFRQAERMANIGTWRLTFDDQRTEWSEQTYAIHGLPAGDGMPMDAAMEFYPPHARAVLQAAVERTLETGEPYNIETDFITAQGEHRRVRSMGELELRQGKPVALIGVFQDITNRYLLEQTLRQTAYTDDLTGIASRSRLNAFLDEQIELAKNHGTPLALLLIDLDNFKIVNDRCGHAAGDDVLRVMASRLQAPYLTNSFVARLGGDEFVLVLSGRPATSALPALLSKLLADLRHTVRLGESVVEVSATIGAAWLGDNVRNRTELLAGADAALYSAKRSRRGSALVAGQERLIRAGASSTPPRLRIVA